MIDCFKGENEFLSNFYEKPVFYQDRQFRNRESAYQWSKFDLETLPLIIVNQVLRFLTTTGSEAKKLAKELKDWVRADWQNRSLGVMSEVIHAYFVQNKDERQKLLDTDGQELIEGNWWHDEFYGRCNCMGKKAGCGEGLGKNWLGRMLMAERAYWLDLAGNGLVGRIAA